MIKPAYTPKLLTRLIWETQSIEDHSSLINLYQALEDQGDIAFSDELKNVFAAPNHYFRFVKYIDDMDQLCRFNLRLISLQQKGFAVVTCMLNRRIAFQRELILAKENNGQ